VAGSSSFTAVLDSNVLYGNLVRDILLSLATAGLYHARWTHEIHREWSSHLVENRPELASKVPLLFEKINSSVPDCLVENYEYLIDSLKLPDLKDRHVLAAAIAGHADAIVTENLKDFPASVLAAYGLEAQHPDDFIMNQLELRPFDALAALKRMRERMAAPVITGVELITLIEKRGLPQTAQFLKGQKTLI
jgi:predicted nucleic acid-binding protein